MSSPFECATASATGADHLRAGRNNQDGLAVEACDDYVVGVVCDGCGSSLHSEVGARLGAKILAVDISTQMRGRNTRYDDVKDIIRIACGNLQFSLSQVIRWFGTKSFVATVQDYFLFSIVGVVASNRDNLWVIFSIGDGVYGSNGAVTKIGPFENNSPPYLGYSMLEGVSRWSLPQAFSPTDVEPKINAVGEIDSTQNLLVGTDGLFGLIDAEHKTIPGKEEVFGHISQLWQNNLFFKNKDSIRRRLSLASRDVRRINSEGRMELSAGILPDDTTLIVLRRTIGES